MAANNNKMLAILRLGAAGATMVIARYSLPVTQEPSGSALIAVIYACAALLALLVYPPRPGSWPVGHLRWCTMLTALLGAFVVVDPAIQLPLPLVVRLCVTFFLLSMTVVTATRALPAPASLALVSLLAVLPVWAAPAVEAAGNPVTLTNVVVALSPVTALATALDLDYLRTNWFYANVALGSMRYSYPAWSAVCLLLAALPASVAATTLLRRPFFSLDRFTNEAKQ